MIGKAFVLIVNDHLHPEDDTDTLPISRRDTSRPLGISRVRAQTEGSLESRSGSSGWTPYSTSGVEQTNIFGGCPLRLLHPVSGFGGSV